MKRRVCDLCKGDNLVFGFKVKSDYTGWWQKIDICRRCWDVLDIAIHAKDDDARIEHKKFHSEITPSFFFAKMRKEKEV